MSDPTRTLEELTPAELDTMIAELDAIDVGSATDDAELDAIKAKLEAAAARLVPA